MHKRNKDKPLLVLVGPTASGKTSLAIQLAKRFDGEIICADSRTIYKGMDIGTAKPSLEEQDGIQHWGLDIVNPGDEFSVSDFKSYATEKIADIRSRGKMPLLAGGTGLYVDSIVFDFSFVGEKSASLRKAMESWSIEELQYYCHKNNINLPENTRNKRFLIRAIERKNISGKRREEPIDNCIVVALSTQKTVLRTRMEFRVEQMFSEGVVNEATILAERYGWESQAMTGNVYHLVKGYLAGEYDIERAKQLVALSDWRLAKRQMTWFRRNSYIEWATLEDAEHYCAMQLSKNE